MNEYRQGALIGSLLFAPATNRVTGPCSGHNRAPTRHTHGLSCILRCTQLDELERFCCYILDAAIAACDPVRNPRGHIAVILDLTEMGTMNMDVQVRQGWLVYVCA